MQSEFFQKCFPNKILFAYLVSALIIYSFLLFTNRSLQTVDGLNEINNIWLLYYRLLYGKNVLSERVPKITHNFLFKKKKKRV
jgi:hypothetical protein